MGRTAVVSVVAMSCGLGLNRTDRAKPRPGATWGSLASSLITSLEEVPCQRGTTRVSGGLSLSQHPQPYPAHRVKFDSIMTTSVVKAL
jgi:hypothetical protein